MGVRCHLKLEHTADVGSVGVAAQRFGHGVRAGRYRHGPYHSALDRGGAIRFDYRTRHLYCRDTGEAAQILRTLGCRSVGVRRFVNEARRVNLEFKLGTCFELELEHTGD